MSDGNAVIGTPSIVTIRQGSRILAVLGQQERNAAWLARKTGKSPAYVSRVLSGQRRPSADFMAAAAEALGVPVELLFEAAP